MKCCHRCGTELTLPSGIARTDACPNCYSDLKCCLNCRLHDPGANNQCREPQAEWQTEKEKSNFCEFFEFRDGSGQSGVGDSGSDRARSTLDALFKKD
jgi:hypothetical protein